MQHHPIELLTPACTWRQHYRWKTHSSLYMEAALPLGRHRNQHGTICIHDSHLSVGCNETTMELPDRVAICTHPPSNSSGRLKSRLVLSPITLRDATIEYRAHAVCAHPVFCAKDRAAAKSANWVDIWTT